MIATMRPDIDNLDEYVRNTTARAFAVVASALGIPALLPFLKAVCQSRKSWQARHTGIKIVMQVRFLWGWEVEVGVVGGRLFFLFLLEAWRGGGCCSLLCVHYC